MAAALAVLIVTEAALSVLLGLLNDVGDRATPWIWLTTQTFEAARFVIVAICCLRIVADAVVAATRSGR